MRLLLVIFVVLIAGYSSAADSTFYKKKAEGWFWYKDPKLSDPPSEASSPAEAAPPHKPQTASPASAPTPAKPAPLSAEWIKSAVESSRQAALDNPTDENVATYLYMNRLMLDKAEAFTDKAAQVSKSDPFLDESARIPISNAARGVVFAQQAQARNQILGELFTRGGIFFFFDSKCSFCKNQYELVKKLSQKYPAAEIRFISTDGRPLAGMRDEFWPDEGQFKTFGLTLTPSIVFAIPPAKVMILSQGLMALDELEARLVAAADREGLINDDIAKSAFIDRRGRLTNSDMQEGKELPDDPKELVKFLKSKLQKRY